MTFGTTRNVIFSPVSASGRMHCEMQGGPMTDLFGLVPARANLSARQARDLGLLTSGTCGQPSITSSRSAALQSSLENRLQVKTRALASVGAPHVRDRLYWVADAAGIGRQKECQNVTGRAIGDETQGVSAGFEYGGCHHAAGATNGFWRNADWLDGTDSKRRPVEPGTFPLVDGPAARVVRLRAYGNAVNAEQARLFIESYSGA